MINAMKPYFTVKSRLNKTIRTTKDYWNTIVELKHPIMKKYEKETKETLREPDEVRRSRKDPAVHLYYRRYDKYFVCVLAKHLNGEGFIITAYLSNNVKKGDIVWRKR